MTGYVGKGGRGLQEVGIVELRFSHQEPTMFQERVILLLLLPSTLLGIVLPTRFLGRFGFDGMEFDGFVTLFDGTVEGTSGRLFLFGLGTDRIHQDLVGIILLIAILHRLQCLVECRLAIEIDVITGIKSMIEAGRLRVLLRTARPKQESGKTNANVIESFSHAYSSLSTRRGLCVRTVQ